MTEHPAAPTTRRGKAVLSEMPDRIRGPWTPFREEQWGGTIATIEAEARDEHDRTCPFPHSNAELNAALNEARAAARKEVLDEIRKMWSADPGWPRLNTILDSLSTDTREEPSDE